MYLIFQNIDFNITFLDTILCFLFSHPFLCCASCLFQTRSKCWYFAKVLWKLKAKLILFNVLGTTLNVNLCITGKWESDISLSKITQYVWKFYLDATIWLGNSIVSGQNVITCNKNVPYPNFTLMFVFRAKQIQMQSI